MSYQHTVVKLKDDHYTGQFLVEKVSRFKIRYCHNSDFKYKLPIKRVEEMVYTYIQIKKIS